MYQYDSFDRDLVRTRAAEFRNQVERRLQGQLTDEEFRPLRLMNGLYLQLHAYMLRIAIPYGVLSSAQLRCLADIGRDYDKGYGHFTTRQNIQFNWIKLVDMPDILDRLAAVEMHAIQTSGNCIRNVTTDPWAGVAADEVADSRPLCELLRQWSSLHPEFSFLPRKFKIAVTGAVSDRAAMLTHDIGIRIKKASKGLGSGRLLYEIWVGGGQGRTPAIAVKIVDSAQEGTVLAWLEAIMRVYNLYGRRDNKYKARIKILVKEMGLEEFRKAVEGEYQKVVIDSEWEKAELERISGFFLDPAQNAIGTTKDEKQAENFAKARKNSPSFDRWADNNLGTHKDSSFAIVTLSLKPKGGIPGDLSSQEMRRVADLADDYSAGELRVTHRQNLVLPQVRIERLYSLWQELQQAGLAEANIGLASDIICCPGLDYCGLATARSIPLAQELSEKFAGREKEIEVGKISINISGCINACGHHHVGNIGILGLEKRGREFYQISLGGDATEKADVGKIAGPGFAQKDVPEAVEKIVDAYVAARQKDEIFIDTLNRIGLDPFKEALYGHN